jgi:hypothetical protein
MPDYKLTREIRDTVATILGSHIFRVSKEDALMQAAAAVLDAQGELKHTKLLMEALRGEIRTLAALQMRQRGVSRLVLTRKELDDLPQDLEVNVEAPEPGVRVYELVAKATAEALSKVVLQ